MISLPALPYPETALEPYLSARAVHFHRRKQERYVHRTNELVRGTSFERLPLGELVREIERLVLADDEDPWIEQVFDQASQAWNHALMWLCMAPPGPRRDIPRTVATLDQWEGAATTVFGSGWVWLCQESDGSPSIQATPDADRPQGRILAVMDVWEHAYYLDYPDDKQRYVRTWWKALADWSVPMAMLDGKIPKELQ